MEKLEFQPGSLIKLRDRDWIIMPSYDKDVLLVKPLGGSDDEMSGIYLPLKFEEDKIESTDFPKPSFNDIADFESAKLLYNATRLSFRNASGPFRCLGKLSFRPRSYQMVPLIMALKQDVMRLLIADDVGIGKTIEALLIAREMLDRGDIKRFAIICLPHLCEQWKDELKNKFSIDAEIIRSSTAARLDRHIGDNSIYKYYPYQIISIDYIKADRKAVFLQHCPELIIVDEVHTCAKPAGAKPSQQQRYHLLHDLSKNPKQHLIMLTATPHSGKQEEFQSLMGLLKASFENVDVTKTDESTRKTIAKHFIQRRRPDVLKWLNEETKFPKRDPGELPYDLSNKYKEVFGKVLNFAQELTLNKDGNKRVQRLKYWTALALLRGVISSPAAGVKMLYKKANNKLDDNDADDFEINPVLDGDDSTGEDSSPTQILEKVDLKSSEIRNLMQMAESLSQVQNLQDDCKAKSAFELVTDWLNKDFNPIIFCRYIATANYLGELLKPVLEKKFKGIQVEVISSELHDEQRKEKISEMTLAPKRLLIATDCLSEGINLQEGFNAIIHYDLPWNPNRLEQREGRIDRFGQKADVVKVVLLCGNNPVDAVVLNVLLRKARQIRESTGISVPFPEDSQTITDAVLHAVLLNPHGVTVDSQMKLDFGESEIIAEKEREVTHAYAEAEKKEIASRNIFRQNAIKPNEIEDDLKEIDEAIGDVAAVEMFVTGAMQFLGVQMDKYKEGYRLFTANLPSRLKGMLPPKNEILISFQSPTPEGYKYLGRNHLFTEQLCQHIIGLSLDKGNHIRAARTSVIRTKEVKEKTVLVQFRVRNVISESNNTNQLVAEEMLLWGFKGNISSGNYLSADEAKKLLMQTVPSANVPAQEQKHWIEEELNWLQDKKQFNQVTDPVGLQRAGLLVESHERYRKVVGGKKFKVVEPVLPMDVLGFYVLLPVVG